MGTTTSMGTTTAPAAGAAEPKDVSGMGMADVWELAQRIDDLTPRMRDAVTERVWDEAGDVAVDYPDENDPDDATDPDGELAEDYGIFPKGTPRVEVFWRWVDAHHSKGLGYIMYDRRRPHAYEA